jgi:hypothetical protein
VARVFGPWRRSALCCSAVAAALLLLAAAAFAAQAPASQEQKRDPRKEYALIYGTVWGKDQRPVYGVTVKIRKADEKKVRWTLVSDHSGEFAQRVPPGAADYVIWADIKMPKGKAKPETKVHVEYDERVDVGLHLTE